MPFSFNFLVAMMLSVFMTTSTLAVPVLDREVATTTDGAHVMSGRSTDTCADPSLARTVFEGYDAASTSHVIHFHWAFVNANTQAAASPATWVFPGPVFQAWPTQQPFTSPLFRLDTPTISDFIFKIGADAQTPPVVSGFSGSPETLVAWVYNTSVCGSVPLMTAVFAAESDHYYTTDPDEHAALLAVGWTDGGVAAFVLPLPTA